MQEEIIRINEKTFVHLINTTKFKSNVITAFLLTDLNKYDVTMNALIPAVLRRGTANLKTMKEMSIKLENMYGAVFDTSVDKMGDKQAIEVYLSSINNKFALNGEDLLTESLEFIYDVIYNPYLEKCVFSKEYVETEKKTIREIIRGRINEKGSYALNECIKGMFENEPFAEFKYGNEKDLKHIDEKKLYKHYLKILAEGEMHFYISGDFEKKKVMEFFHSKFDKREIPEDNIVRTSKTKNLRQEEKKIIEKMKVTQGKLVLGYDVDVDLIKDFYKMTLFNTMLGASANSKLFQNVREKESLAYTIRSMYLKHKGVMFITAGIELSKYEKALELTKKQVQDMCEGNFTDEDLADAKTFLANAYRTFEDDQVSQIEMSVGNFVLGLNEDVQTMIDGFNNVTREDVIEVANKVKLTTLYYLCA
ncbi:MAG: insulinase family protein [Clostridia bacterium]|nr:insulinase family protein [Clostridia bacterium]